MRYLIILLFLILPTTLFSKINDQRTFKVDGPNSIELGSENNYLSCSFLDQRIKKECRVGSFSNLRGFYSDKNFRFTKPGFNKLKVPFAKNPDKELLDKADVFMSKNPVMALLIIKDGKRILEKYQYNRNQDHRFRAFSVSKSFVAMLVGIAIEKGYIKSINDNVGMYWPEIKNSEYGKIKIINLLKMSSTIFSRDGSIDPGESPTKDMYKFLFTNLNYWQPEKFDKYLNNIKKNNTFKQGSKPIYTSVDSEVLTRVLIKATGKGISELLQEWIWEPMGGWSSSWWLYSKVDFSENGGGGFSATLNDYGRFGILLANDGKRDNLQIIPKNFLHNGTRKSKIEKNFLNVGKKFQFGYGYQTWILDFENETFCARGHYGQFLCVQPSTKIVFVQFSAGEHKLWETSLYHNTYSFLKYTLKKLEN